MTTPEKVRRRQRIEIGLVVVVAVGSILYGVFNEREEDVREQCIVEAFAASSKIDRARSKITDRAVEVQERADGVKDRRLTALETLVTDAFAAETPDEALQAFARFNQTKEELVKRRENVQDAKARLVERRENARPPKFPDGKCE